MSYARSGYLKPAWKAVSVQKNDAFGGGVWFRFMLHLGIVVQLVYGAKSLTLLDQRRLEDALSNTNAGIVKYSLEEMWQNNSS